jgi:hypothetical protein
MTASIVTSALRVSNFMKNHTPRRRTADTTVTDIGNSTIIEIQTTAPYSGGNRYEGLASAQSNIVSVRNHTALLPYHYTVLELLGNRDRRISSTKRSRAA